MNKRALFLWNHVQRIYFQLKTILIGTREQIANADVLIPKNLYIAFICFAKVFSLYAFLFLSLVSDRVFCSGVVRVFVSTRSREREGNRESEREREIHMRSTLVCNLLPTIFGLSAVIVKQKAMYNKKDFG